MATYSFLDVQATLVGPGGAIPLGSGSAASEEGISVEFVDDLTTMAIGADGQGVHSLHASKGARLRVRLLKTSPVNAALTTMCNFQRLSSSTFGRNVMVVTNIATGDTYSARQCAFARNPANTWGKDAQVIEWEFVAIQCDYQLGISV